MTTLFLLWVIFGMIYFSISAAKQNLNAAGFALYSLVGGLICGLGFLIGHFILKWLVE